jgi:PAS domain S-box-containing protein
MPLSSLKRFADMGRRFWFKSVRRQLILGVASVHAVLMTFFVFDLVERQQNFLFKESVARASSLAQTLASTSRSWALANDLTGLEEVVSALRAFPGLEYALISSPRGRVLAHTNSSLVGLFLVDEISASLTSLADAAPLAVGEDAVRELVVTQELIDVAAPILSGGRLLGWARISLNQTGQHENLHLVTRNGVAYTLLAILMGAAMAMLIAKRLTAGLVGLMRASDKVQAGEREVLADESRIDEIGVLGRGFNRMLASIRASERSLTESLEWKRTVQDSSSAAILIVTGDRRILEVNPAFCEMFGYAENEILGRSTEFIFPSYEAFQRFGEGFYTHDAQGGQPARPLCADAELEFKRRNGERLWCRVSGRSIAAADWDKGIIWILQDISARVKAEQGLRQSEERFRTIADFTFDWEYWLGPDGAFLWVSPSCERVTGYGPDEFISDPELFLRITHEDDLPMAAEHQRESATNQSLAPCSFDYRIRGKTGVLLWVNHCCRAILGPGGAFLGRRGCMRDISESKRTQDEFIAAKERAESASLAKDHFLATMSHEIRTPLNGVMGMLQLLRRTPLNSEQSQWLNVALDSSRKLMIILSDILDIAKIQTGKVLLCFEEIDLSQILRAATDVFEEELSRKGLRLRIDIAPATPPKILSDAGRLRQILFNLVGNAVKFTEKGEISLSVSPLPFAPDPGQLRLLFIVSDTGVGVPEDKAAFIFKTFSQLDGSFSRKFGGLGLGLPIVKRFVELLGGSICVESGPKEGASFYFTITSALPSASNEQPPATTLSV